MIIQRQCPFTGKHNTMDIPVTPKQYLDWQSGIHIQNAMPDLTPDQREFIKTGITPDQWDAMFK